MNALAAHWAWKVARAAGCLGPIAAVAVVCASAADAGDPLRAAAPPGPLDAGTAGPASALTVDAQRGQVSPPDLGEVERMCALLTSCDRLPIPPSLYPDDFAACVKKMSDDMSSAAAINFSLTLRECGLQSTSCDALRTCALHGANPEACVGRGKQGVIGFCDIDGRALTCWHDQTLAVRDCPRGGEQCLVIGGQATCSLGSCPGTFTDGTQGDRPRCSPSGSHLLRCDKGKLASLDCTAFGLKCTVAADGTAGCATGGAPCAAGVSRCDGNTAVGCVNGHEVRVECSAAGLACNQVAGSGTQVGACVASPLPSGACDPSDKARCDDANIRYCAAGRPRAFSCKTAGFNRCDTSSKSGGIRCAP